MGRPRQRRFSFHWTTCKLQRLWNMRSPAPVPPIAASLMLPAIFWGQNSEPVRPYALIFFGFSFVGAILRLLILLILCFKLFVVLQTCILMIYTYPSFRGIFWSIWREIYVYICPTILFFSSYLFLFFSSYLFLFFSFSYLLLFFKLFVVLQACVLNTHWANVQN